MGRGRESVIVHSQGMMLACTSLTGGLGSGRGRGGQKAQLFTSRSEAALLVRPHLHFMNDVGPRELKTICYLFSLEDPDCVCMCKISKYLKTSSILWNTALAKQNTCAECPRKQSRLGQDRSSNPLHQTKIHLSTQEPRRHNLLGLLRKLETHTKRAEKLNTRNSGEIWSILGKGEGWEWTRIL